MFIRYIHVYTGSCVDLKPAQATINFPRPTIGSPGPLPMRMKETVRFQGHVG